jgi:hypothetical protein
VIVHSALDSLAVVTATAGFYFLPLPQSSVGQPCRLHPAYVSFVSLGMIAGALVARAFRDALDRFNFCLAGVKRSCIHFVTPGGRISVRHLQYASPATINALPSFALVSAPRNRRGLFALRARMGDPGPVAAALIRALYRTPAVVEPKRYSAAPP